MLGIIVGIAISWYFFNFMENNSYIKNVLIYAGANFATNLISQAFSGGGISIISNIIASIIGGLLLVKLMEFTRRQVNSLLGFILLNEVCMIGISFCLALILTPLFL